MEGRGGPLDAVLILQQQPLRGGTAPLSTRPATAQRPATVAGLRFKRRIVQSLVLNVESFSSESGSG